MSKIETHKEDGKDNTDNRKYISEIRKKLQQQQDALKKLIENLKNEN